MKLDLGTNAMAGLCELQLLIVAALVELHHFINWQFWCVRFTKKMSDKFNTVALINISIQKLVKKGTSQQEDFKVGFLSFFF